MAKLARPDELDARVRVYSINAAASALGCDRRSIYRYRRKGRLRFTHRIGDRFHISHRELRRFSGRPVSSSETDDIDAATRVYSVARAAELLCKDPSVVYGWLRTGELEGFHNPAGHLRVAHEDLVDFLLEREVEPA